MAKREHFIEADIVNFLNYDDWATVLPKRVNLHTTTKFKHEHFIDENISFASILIHHAVLSNTMTFEQLIEDLNSINYKFSLNDFRPYQPYAGPHTVLGDRWIEIFDFATQQGFNLKDISQDIYNSLTNVQHEQLLQYIDTNITPVDIKSLHFENIKKLWRELPDDDNVFILSSFDDEVDFLSLVDQSDIDEENQKTDQTTQKILDFISNATHQEMLDLLANTHAPSILVRKYVDNNNLNISIFCVYDYINSMPYKPSEIFTSNQLKVINILETKTQTQFIDKNMSDAQEMFNHIKNITGKTFNEQLVFKQENKNKP